LIKTHLVRIIIETSEVSNFETKPHFIGIQGRRIYKHKGIEIWSRPITPVFQTYYSYAVVFVNRRTDGTPSDVAVTLRELGLQSPTGYRVEVLDNERFIVIITNYQT
jgi:Alpha galactosidase A C-terminal beta sandwich domain